MRMMFAYIKGYGFLMAPTLLKNRTKQLLAAPNQCAYNNITSLSSGSCVLFARISQSRLHWTGCKFSLRPNTHFHCLLEQRISRQLANVIYSVYLFNQKKNISIS